jgi:hypothetical protein
MYLSIIILPLLGSIVSGFFGRKVGVRGAQIITCSCVIVTTILALLAFVEVGFNNIPVTINLFRWIDSEWFNIIWGFQFDALTVSMLIPVLIISSLVHIYSIGYMSNDPRNINLDGFRRITLNKHRLGPFKYHNQKRYYSNSNRPMLEGKNFYEWLSGLADSEGSFVILKKQDGYRFQFQIHLHIDDLKMLLFIQSTLLIGKVNISVSSASFTVSSAKDMVKILDIFSEYTLNSHKFLNFINFKKAFEVYTSSRLKSQDTLDKVESLRLEMNSLRVDFTLPSSHSIRITPYWFLGFVEGDGSFYIRKGFAVSFNIAQSSKDLILMEAVKDYLNNLGPKAGSLKNRVELDGAVKLSYKKSSNMTYLVIHRSDYISQVLIPFFDSLTWQSKKELDYIDWKTIFKLRNLGLHYTDEGVKVLNSILEGMNNNRLTTSGVTTTTEQRETLNRDVARLLEGPSNFEIKEDERIFIKSLNKYYSSKAKIRLELVDGNGETIKSFASAVDCAKYLKVSKMTISLRLRNGKPFLFEDKFVSINKSLDMPL